MGSSTNTTTQNSSLPSGITNGLQSALDKSVNASNLSNPAAGITQGTATWGNPAQVSALNTTGAIQNYQPQMVSSNYGTPTVATGYQAQQVGTGDVTRYGSPHVSGDQISSYMNPYASQVIGTSLDELNRQLSKTNQMSSGQAAQAGAFGGDRAAIVNTENNRNANQIAASTIANLNSQNYSQAAGLAGQDASRALQAGTSQSQLEANTGEANQYAQLQANNLNATQDRSNQAAGLTTNALNATQDRSNQSAGLTGANLNLSAAGQANTIGNSYQQTQQNAANALYNQQYRDAMYPVTSASTLASDVGTLANGYRGTGTTTTTTPGASVTGQVAGAATALTGINSLTGGAITNGVKSLFSSGSGTDTTGQGFDSAGTTLSDTGNAVAQAGDQAASEFNFRRGGIVGYADGGPVRGYLGGGPVTGSDTYVPISTGAPSPNDVSYLEPQQSQSAPIPSGVGALNPTNPALAAPDLERARAQAAAAQAAREALFTKAQQDFTALRTDPDKPVNDVSQAAQMAAAKVAQDQGFNEQQAGQFSQQLRSRLGIDVPQQKAAPAPQAAPQGQPDAQPAQQSTGPMVNPTNPNVNKALAINPADYLDQQGSDALAQPNFGTQPASDPSWLGGSVAHGQSAPQAGLAASQPPAPQAGLAAADTSTPAPQPVGGGIAGNRISQSANPGNPLPSGAPGGQPSDGSGGQGGDSWSHNKLGMALLSAGLGMMASKSHTALGAIGEGGQAGLQQLQTMTQHDDSVALRKAQMEDTAAYRRGVVGVNQQRANQQGDHFAAQDDNNAAKTDMLQARTDAYVTRSLAQAQKAQGATSATILQSAMDAYKQQNPGANDMDALQYAKGLSARNQRWADLGAIAQQKLDLAKQAQNNTQDWRAWQQASKATDQEKAGARTIVNSAAQMGKQVSMDQALQQVRSSRANAGPAPIVGNPIGQQQGGAGPQRVASVAEAMALPVGTQFIGADGVLRVRH